MAEFGYSQVLRVLFGEESGPPSMPDISEQGAVLGGRPELVDYEQGPSRDVLNRDVDRTIELMRRQREAEDGGGSFLRALAKALCPF